MAPDVGLGLGGLSVDDLSALQLAAQVMAHRAMAAGLPRVGAFFDHLEAEVVAERAARGQHGARATSDSNPWRVGGLSANDRTAIGESIELLAANPGLSAPVRSCARRLLAAKPLS